MQMKALAKKGGGGSGSSSNGASGGDAGSDSTADDPVAARAAMVSAAKAQHAARIGGSLSSDSGEAVSGESADPEAEYSAALDREAAVDQGLIRRGATDADAH